MKLIVGLGNPGERYRNNRHNVGFKFIDFIREKLDGADCRLDKKFEAEISEVKSEQGRVYLVKPIAFMNKSGEAVKKIKNFYKIQTDEIFVAHDDLDLRLGEYKIQKGKGPRLHNGVVSIERELGATDFWRVRIGVDNREPENRMPGEAYVLQDLEDDETTTFDKLSHSIFDSLASKFK